MGLKIDWQGDDLANLIELPNPELYRLYGEFFNGNRRTRNETIRRKANHYRKLIKTGKIPMPKRSYEYDPQQEPERIEARRRKAAKNLGAAGAVGADVTVITVPNEHLVYHEQLQEALNADGRVERATFQSGEHTGFIKNSDNEIEYTEPMKSARAKFEVNFNVEPKWPVPTRVESVKLQRKEALKPKEIKTCMVFPDLQIPFESEEALEVALGIMMEIKPDKVVFLGDLLDLSAWGKYVQQKEFAFATQDAIIKAHKLLASIRKSLPSAEIQVLSGNHESRLENNLLQNAKEAYGLKRADQLNSWPVMSVPYLCAFDQLDIEYVPGYPANRVWLNRNLQIRHGTKTGKKGAGVRQNTAAEKISTIQGHDHRLSMHSSTINTYEGGQQLFSYGSGCLCRLDGRVPSVWQGRDLEGTPVKQYEDWQNGFVIAHYDEENFFVEQVPIGLDYRTMYRGKIYEPTREEPGYA